jgi:3-hydroxyisobutyrate dehydrogenase-like beta-hydroxyacid dehydrogenase
MPLSTFAVLGLGEAGGRIATDLAAAGVDVRGYDPRVENGVAHAVDAVFGRDVVLSFTSASAARAAAAGVQAALVDAAVYADLNATAPALKRELLVELGVEPRVASASRAMLADLE